MFHRGLIAGEGEDSACVDVVGCGEVRIDMGEAGSNAIGKVGRDGGCIVRMDYGLLPCLREHAFGSMFVNTVSFVAVNM